MSTSSRCLIASLTVAVSLLFGVTSGAAQDIRTYGNQSGGSTSGGGGGGGGSGGQMAYPGQPRPQNQGSGNQQQGNQQQDGEEEGTTGSYAIQIHEPGERFDDENQDGEGQSEEDGQPDIFDQPSNKIYKGIIPGDRDQVDHLRTGEQSDESTSGANRLTWIGFQPKETKSRIFVQFSDSPQYSVSRKDDDQAVVLSFEQAEVAAGNFRRHIDTRFFERNVTRIETEVAGNNTVEMSIQLDDPASPSVETDGNYLYVDFAHDSQENDESGE